MNVLSMNLQNLKVGFWFDVDKYFFLKFLLQTFFAKILISEIHFLCSHQTMFYARGINR